MRRRSIIPSHHFLVPGTQEYRFLILTIVLVLGILSGLVLKFPFRDGALGASNPAPIQTTH